MPDALQSITQADFSAGAFPGLEDVPLNGVEDIVDGFLRDDGAIERRGGTAYKSNANFTPANTALQIWDGYLAGGRRTVAYDDQYLHILSVSDDATPVQIGSAGATAFSSHSRPVELAGMLFHTLSGTFQDQVYIYGGASAPQTTGVGTVTLTQGSADVTGVGTSFASLTAGAIINPTGFQEFAAVKSIASNTSLTLAEEWPYTTRAAVAFILTSATSPALQYTTGGAFFTAGTSAPQVYAAAIHGRLVVAAGNRVHFSAFLADSSGVARPTPFRFEPTDFHLLPDGVIVTGLQASGAQLLVFTTAGVYTISNLAFDLTDDYGNPQQQVAVLNRDMNLWGDVGIATWNNAALVPATEDLYLLADQVQAVTGGARKLYREYVKAGYRVGQAAVYRGHYFLPILPSSGTSSPIDLLVWRLDRLSPAGAPFMRWAGHAASSRAFAIRSTDPSRSPKLLSVADSRVLEMTDTLQPSSSFKADANGTAHQLKITSRSIMLSETIDHTLRFGRLRYELDDAASDNPTFTAEWSRGRPGSSFTALTGSASEGEDTFTWPLAKSGQQTRMRFTSNNAAAKAVVRAMEFKVRQHGRA